MVIDGLHAGKPLIRRVIFDKPGDLSGGAHAFAVGINPYAYEKSGIKEQ